MYAWVCMEFTEKTVTTHLNASHLAAVIEEIDANIVDDNYI